MIWRPAVDDASSLSQQNDNLVLVNFGRGVPTIAKLLNRLTRTGFSANAFVALTQADVARITKLSAPHVR
jgi:hypothetical protein